MYVSVENPINGHDIRRSKREQKKTEIFLFCRPNAKRNKKGPNSNIIIFAETTEYKRVRVLFFCH